MVEPSSPPPPSDAPPLRAIVYGAETPPGRAIAVALRDAGATVAVASATTDGAALFALTRAAAGAAAEATDLANETSVRVATRKLAKALGGVDVAIVAAGDAAGARHAITAASREVQRRSLQRERGVTGWVIVLIGDAPDRLAAVRAAAGEGRPVCAVAGSTLEDGTRLALYLATKRAGDAPSPVGGVYTDAGATPQRTALEDWPPGRADAE